jgi:arsenate reductase
MKINSDISATTARRVLFLCVANSARSQMAEGLAKAKYPEGLFQSAGSVPSTVNPRAQQVMAELGIDLSSHYSKSVDDISPGSFDVVATLCAEESCPASMLAQPRWDWAISDPASDSPLSDEAMLQRFRAARDQVASLVDAMPETIALELGK